MTAMQKIEIARKPLRSGLFGGHCCGCTDANMAQEDHSSKPRRSIQFLNKLGEPGDKLSPNVTSRHSWPVRWRSDYDQALRLGESVAISILRDQRAIFNEKFDGFTFTNFDGIKLWFRL